MGILRFLSRRRPGKGVKLENGADNNSKPPKGSVECKVQLLDGTDLTVFVPKKAPAQELYEQVFESLDLLEKDYFGLQYSDTHQVKHWLDPTKTVKKQIKIGPPYTLRLRVKFYSLEPQSLREEITRYQLFLQLKQDIQTGRLPCPFDTAVELAAYILQSELGDYDPKVHNPESISEFRFVPVEEQTEEMEAAILESYKKLQGQTPAQVELSYLNKVKWLEMYGVDMHPVFGKDSKKYLLGLTPHGVLVIEIKPVHDETDEDEAKGSPIIIKDPDDDQVKRMNKLGFFLWPKVTRLLFNKKKLTIVTWEDDEYGGPQDHTFVFRLRNKKAAKHLWKCAVEHHTFFRLSGAQKEPTPRQNFFRMGSRFRYSGKTEMQTANEKRIQRTVQFERRPSQRYSRRTSVRGRPPAAAPAGVTHASSTFLQANPTASASSMGTTEIIASSSIGPAPALPPKIIKPSSQRNPSVSSSSCEVISTTILHLDNNPPPIPPRLGEYKRSPSLSEIAKAEEPPVIKPRTPVASPVHTINWTSNEPTWPSSPTKPVRSFNMTPIERSPLMSSQPSVPFTLQKQKPSIVKPKSEDMDLKSVPFEVEKSHVIVQSPTTVTNGFSSSYERNPPREINGFKLSSVDAAATPKSKESASKELVSILKNSDTTHNSTVASTKLNGSRHPSSDSGRASPPSSPSASPSRASSALSAVSKSGSRRFSVEFCDKTPLLYDSEEDHEEALPTPLLVSVPALLENATASAVVASAVNDSDAESDTAALLENFQEQWCDVACGPSANGSNTVSRSGSGASTGSTEVAEKYIPITVNNSAYQPSSWLLPEVKTLPPYTSLNSNKLEPEKMRRVITTEL